MLYRGEKLISDKGKKYCKDCLDLIKNPIDKEKLLSEWTEFVKEIKKDKKHNLLVSFSGGKDSTAAMHIAKQSGLNVTAFVIDHRFKGKKAGENIYNVTRYLGVDLIIIQNDLT